MKVKLRNSAMKRQILLMLLTIFGATLACTAISLKSNAQTSLLTCKIIYPTEYKGVKHVQCNVTGDSVAIEDIVFNRGNCKSPREAQEEMEQLVKSMGRRPIPGYAPIGRTFKFGDQFEVSVGACNLIEFQIKRNGQWVSFSVK